MVVTLRLERMMSTKSEKKKQWILIVLMELSGMQLSLLLLTSLQLVNEIKMHIFQYDFYILKPKF